MSFGVLERDSRMGLIDQVLVLRVVIDHPADYRAHDSNRFPCAPDVVKGLCDQLGSYAMVAVGGEHRRVPQRDPVTYQPVSEVSDLLVPEQRPVDVLVLVVSDRNLIIRRRHGDERPAGIRVTCGSVGHVLEERAGPLVEPLTVIAERPGHLHWPPLLWRACGALGHWCGSPSALGSGRHPGPGGPRRRPGLSRVVPMSESRVYTDYLVLCVLGRRYAESAGRARRPQAGDQITWRNG